MPQIIHYNGYARTVATEAELLAFVNKARKAGGANILDALLPAFPEDSEECLIAVGLNFGCTVAGLDRTVYDPAASEDVRQWGMFLPTDMPPQRVRAIASALDCEITSEEPGYPNVILLPLEIGNAAWAFDRRLAFNNLIDPDYDPDEY